MRTDRSQYTNIDLGWYKYGLTLFETSFEKVDLLEAGQDSVWIDSLQKYLFTADVSGFASGISLYLSCNSPPKNGKTHQHALSRHLNQ